MHRRKDAWRGTAGELLATISAAQHTDEATRRRIDFPKTPKAMASDLRRLAPALRMAGLEIVFHEPSGHEKRRIIEISRSADQNGERSPLTLDAATDCESHVFDPTAVYQDVPTGEDASQRFDVEAIEGAPIQGEAIGTLAEHGQDKPPEHEPELHATGDPPTEANGARFYDDESTWDGATP
jgi:hypothetical protein